MTIQPSFEQPADAGNWLTLVEFRTEISAGGSAGAAALTERLAEILIPLLIPDQRLRRIQSAVENAVLQAAARSGEKPLETLSLRIFVSRTTPGEAPSSEATRSLRNTLPIWTGGPYGWGFFLVERAGEDPGRQGPAGSQEGYLIQLFLYPEGGE